MQSRLHALSATRLWARLVGGFYPAPKPETDLPPDVRHALLPKLEETAKWLETERQRTVERIDNRALWMMPLGMSPVLLMLVPGFGFMVPLILASAGALLAWGVAASGPAKRWQNEVREGFAKTYSEQFLGLAHTAMPKPDAERLEALRLFGRIKKVDVADRLTGRRNGRDLALSTMRIMYSPHASRANPNSGSPILFCEMVEVETPTDEAPLIVGVGKGAYDVLRDTPREVHGLEPFDVADAEFSKAFFLFGSDAAAAKRFLDADLRGALLTLAEKHGHEPPHFTIMPGRMAILFPRLSLKTLFSSRPYWEPLDAQRTLSRVSSGLAYRSAMIDDVLSLPLP